MSGLRAVPRWLAGAVALGVVAAVPRSGDPAGPGSESRPVPPPAADLPLLPAEGSFLDLEVRVGVRVAADTVSVFSPAGLAVVDARTGSVLGTTEGPQTLHVSATGWTLAIEGLGRPAPPAVFAARFEPAGVGAPVFLDGIPYRGAAEIVPVEGGLVTGINVLRLEEYLLGVVPLEIGPRRADEHAAVQAQAVAARTYAIAHLRRRAEMGFDLYASVEDQAYGGMLAEREEATAGVRETAGTILVYGGRAIRALYHSTCGGRTAPVEEVLNRPPAPYLRSVEDRAPDGSDYCSSSPRYRWEASLTRDELNGRVREALARKFGTSPDSLGELRHLRVLRRTPSGRVGELAVSGEGVELVVARLDIREVLRPEGSALLNSTDFTIRERDDGLVELHGRGYGHGAGMCQWGAIGRARAGQTYEQILSAYYPGAELVRAYTGGRK